MVSSHILCLHFLKFHCITNINVSFTELCRSTCHTATLCTQAPENLSDKSDCADGALCVNYKWIDNQNNSFPLERSDVFWHSDKHLCSNFLLSKFVLWWLIDDTGMNACDHELPTHFDSTLGFTTNVFKLLEEALLPEVVLCGLAQAHTNLRFSKPQQTLTPGLIPCLYVVFSPVYTLQLIIGPLDMKLGLT